MKLRLELEDDWTTSGTGIAQHVAACSGRAIVSTYSSRYRVHTYLQLKRGTDPRSETPYAVIGPNGKKYRWHNTVRLRLHIVHFLGTNSPSLAKVAKESRLP